MKSIKVFLVILLFLFNCENKNELTTISVVSPDTINIIAMKEPVIDKQEKIEIESKMVVEPEIDSVYTDTTDSKTIYLGMPKEMVVARWGVPNEIVREKWGLYYETWVYNRIQPRLDKRISNVTYLLIKSDTLVSVFDK